VNPPGALSPREPDGLIYLGDGHVVDPRGPGASVSRDPIERHEQRRRVTHEIEQVIELANRIVGCPTVEFGLHLRYPPTGVPELESSPN
jgi:hypothetical protein